ncbi:MAG: peptidoglycan DD-metalloendopeptidase family protein [Thermodesulforhabdaceae bacterium]
MKNIHPLRGLLWIALALTLSSINAEGTIDREFQISRISQTPVKLLDYSPEWTTTKYGASIDENLDESLLLAKMRLSGQITDSGTKRSTSNSSIKVISGQIENNFYSSAIRAGLHPSLVLDFADIFSSDIDFTSDLRRGDTFSVVVWKNPGNPKSNKGMILAARINVQGETYEAFFFQPPGQKGAYYDSNGKSLTRAFLKAPLQYRRISSMFTARRFHPILRIYRPHYGIDYAAPTGTPVSAIGSGKIVFMGKKGGFGNLVEIKHNGVYSSSYGHLSRFARGLRVGQYVERGQVIGYVGKTGLATGPHLDFRFYANGRPINFAAMANNIPMASIPRTLAGHFRNTVEYYRMLMAQEGSKKVASNPAPSN